MKKRFTCLLTVFLLLSFAWTADADAPNSLLEGLGKLFGETGLTAIHLEAFSFEQIDFDTILHIMGSDLLDYSALNYDALLVLPEDPEFSSLLGIGSISREDLNALLQDEAFEGTILAMMEKARAGGSISGDFLALTEDQELREKFLRVTNGTDLIAELDGLDPDDRAAVLNKAASALLSPRTVWPSETAVLLSRFVQKASDTLSGE